VKIKDIIVESSNMASAEQIWDYVGGIHPKDQQGGGFLKRLIMRNPQYELKRVPLSSLHVPNDEDDGDDPYGRAMFVDVDHAREYSQHHVDKKPVVADAEGHILDGAHRAWAAAELLNRTDIMAWVPATKLTESQSVKQEIEELLDSLTPDDVGVEEFPGYRVHFEGFTDDCKLSSDYQKNPDKVYQQVYQDFVQREGGKKPAKSGMVGDEEYPILYSVFRVPQSKTVDTAERAYSIAYRKKQPWPRGSREEKLIRSEWQLSALYDQYVLKQGVAEGKDFDRCFDQACKLYDRAVSRNLEPKLVQVADFQGDGNGADPRWMKLPQHVWQHYVVIVGDQVLDPTAKQFGDSMPTQYKVSDLDRLWGKQYQIRPRQGVAEEQLDELFQPGKQNWAWKIKADNEAIAKFTVGDRDYVWQAFSHFRDDKPHKWEIQFRVVKQSTDPEKLQVYGTTGTGNSAEVMSNAVDIMREFLQYYGDGVQQIAFDAKENSRIALYRKMVQRLLPNWNADEDYNPEYGLRFTLTRPKSVAETRIINAERVDVYYRPVPTSRGRRVVARNIPAAALEPLLKKLSEKYAVPVASFEWSAAQGVVENFADGRNPGRKGLAKRSGVNTKASVSSLRKTAKNSSGEKQRMAHWLANMKAGRAKARRK
jgi:hypothetical protein